MCWESVWVLHHSKLSITVLGLALPELALWGAGSVAVVGGRAKGLFFAVVLDEEEFDEDRQEEEDAVVFVSQILYLFEVKGVTYQATMATAKQAVSSLHAV